MTNDSKVIKCAGYRWQGIGVREYKRGGGKFKGVTRQTLIGDGAGEGDVAFVTRYFEVEPGGHSTLERHRHPHSVVVLRGSGQVTLGDEAHDLEPFDCVYVAPGTVHQFRAGPREPLGFLCVVDRVRDRPQPVA
ncbi:MAG: cupin domain-containing protein [Gemmatimonadota bacterium]|nr:MAG: cupin domain-containing protein [Gemmatimonadota bacterium]